jgi:hypothetical protein
MRRRWIFGSAGVDRIRGLPSGQLASTQVRRTLSISVLSDFGDGDTITWVPTDALHLCVQWLDSRRKLGAFGVETKLHTFS